MSISASREAAPGKGAFGEGVKVVTLKLRKLALRVFPGSPPAGMARRGNAVFVTSVTPNGIGHA